MIQGHGAAVGGPCCRHSYLICREGQDFNQPVSQSCAVAKNEHPGGPPDNRTWQTECSIAKVQLCEYESQTLEAFVVNRRCMQSLIVQWRAIIYHLAIAHVCDTGFLPTPMLPLLFHCDECES